MLIRNKNKYKFNDNQEIVFDFYSFQFLYDSAHHYML